MIEADIEELQKQFGGDTSVKDILTGGDDAEYFALERILIATYKEKGLSEGNASKAASAKLTRIRYYLDNKQAEENWVKQRDKWEDAEDAKSLNENLEFATKTITDAMEKAKITIAIDKYSFSQVIADGQFKNQFETKRSGGLLDTNVRKEGEAIILDIPITAPAKNRPIYGYLTDNNKPSVKWEERNRDIEKTWQEILSLDNQGVEQYGAIKIVLKDTVRPNTTVTIGDSLRTGNLSGGIMEPNPDLTQMGLYTKGAPAHMGGFPAMNYLEVQISDVITVSDIAAIYAPREMMEDIRLMLADKNLDITVLEIGTE
jgi:hypothetical protein